MQELTITGEVGFRKDGSLDILTSMGNTNIVWNLDFTENADKFIVSLTDSTSIENERNHYEILHSFETNDSIEARVEIGSIVREWIPAVNADYIDCLKDMIHRVWGNPRDVKMGLMLHHITHLIGDHDDLKGDESWD